jgi:hypothetical protein
VGGFQPGFGAFMPLREHPDRPATPPPPTLADDEGVETASWLSPHPLNPVSGSITWGFFVQVVLPGLHARRIYLSDDDLATELSTPDGSWAAVAHTPQNGSYRTIQGGPGDCGIYWKPPTSAGGSWANLAGNASASPSPPTSSRSGSTHRTANTTGPWPTLSHDDEIDNRREHPDAAQGRLHPE